MSIICRFDCVYLDDDLRVAKDIRGDYLVVDRAPYEWKECFALRKPMSMALGIFVLFQMSHAQEAQERDSRGWLELQLCQIRDKGSVDCRNAVRLVGGLGPPRGCLEDVWPPLYVGSGFLIFLSVVVLSRHFIDGNHFLSTKKEKSLEIRKDPSARISQIW
ncbi:hypothetical protein RJ639_039328 [Escallonia herrerae]|uniref:Uncharacterized protein n=1 Tax=Escallonia herrerae TaxID=1293975 RepID=A0AA88WS24_9ASTE|nr:hypothetical protein RJ639_039328 [Escallonia herrerae]